MARAGELKGGSSRKCVLGGGGGGGGLKETRNFDDQFSCGTAWKEGLLQKMALKLEEVCS